MRSKASVLDGCVDWPAANAVLGIGVKEGGVPCLSPNPVGAFGAAHRIRDIARSLWVSQVVQLLEKNPQAHSVEIKKKWRLKDVGSQGGVDRYDVGSGSAYLGGYPDAIPEDDWPVYVEDEDWDLIDASAAEICFCLSREAVDAFTINGLRTTSPLAEMIVQQQSYLLTPEEAFAHVYSAYGAERVAQGHAPRRWGVPGLKLLSTYLAQGGSPNAMDAAGMTPLALAIYLEQHALVRQLTEAGGALNAPTGGLFPIDVAVLSGNVEMVRLCCELGAAPTTNGFVQPLFRAVDMTDTGIMLALIEAGADMDVQTADGLTLSQYVEQSNGGLRKQFLSILTAKSIERAIDSSGVQNGAPKRKQSFSL